MNLNLFTTFIRVIEKKSLSGAAHDLFLTQPAVSKQIQTLEDRYGVRLLERVGRQIRLTEAGEIFYQHALEILRTMEELNEALIRTTAEVRGRLLIGASTVPGQYILPSFIGCYKRRYPEVKVSLEIGDTSSIVNSLLEQRIDLAVVGAAVKNRKLTSALFADDQLRLIVPADHPLAARASIRIEELVKENLIWREKGSGTRRVLEDRLAEQGVSLDKLNILLELGSTEAVITAVEEGLGIALVSRWAIDKSTALGRIVSPELAEVDLQRSLYLVCRRQKIYSRAVQAFFDLSNKEPTLTG